MRAEVLRDRFVLAVSTIAALALLGEMVMLPALRTNVVRAGDNAWTPIGPSGGSVLSLASSRTYATDGTVFAATSYGVFVSYNGGASWQTADDGLPRTYLSTVSVSPDYANDLTLFAGSSYLGVYKSTDGGKNWEARNNGLDARSVQVIAFSPDYAHDGTVFAGINGRPGAGGLYRSTNRGQSWDWCRSIPDWPRDAPAIAFSPGYATDRTVYIATSGYGVFRSTDGGDTWTSVSMTLPHTAKPTLAISPNFESDRILYVGIYDTGVYRTTDGGVTWSLLRLGLDGMALRIWGMSISPDFGTDGTLFLSTESGLFKTSDGGSHWQPSGTVRHTVKCVAMSPGFGMDGCVFAGSVVGVHKTTDRGTSWNAVNNGLLVWEVDAMVASPNYADDGTVFAGRNVHPNPAPVLRTADGGATWDVSSAGLDVVSINCLAVSPNFPSNPMLLAGTEPGLWKSSDHGDSWQQVGIPWSGNDRNVRAVGIGAGGEVFAATTAYIYCSDDGGVHWRTHSTDWWRSALCLAISPNYASDGMLVMGASRGIQVSVNRGRSWSTSRAGLPAYAGARSIVFSPGFATDGTLFAALSGKDGGVYKSTDRGTTWQGMNNGIQRSAEAVAISANYRTDQTVYAGTSGSGVFRSEDGGASWLPVGDGPRDRRVRALFVSDSADPVILAGTVGSGVWQYRLAAATPTPTVTHRPTHTATASPTATQTPTSTATPTATATEPASALYLPIVMRD